MNEGGASDQESGGVIRNRSEHAGKKIFLRNWESQLSGINQLGKRGR